MLFTIDKKEGIGDPIGIVHNGEVTYQAQTEEGVLLFDANGKAVPGHTAACNGPEGMRYLTILMNGEPAQLMVEFFNYINGPKTATLVPWSSHTIGSGPLLAEIYVCAEGTGSPEQRQNLISLMTAMDNLGYHNAQTVATILPQLPEDIRDIYQDNPRGEVLWEELFGQNPYDVTLPDDRIPRDESLDMQALRHALFTFDIKMQPSTDGVIVGQKIPTVPGQSISINVPEAEGMRLATLMPGNHEIWGNRICNLMNEQMGWDAFLFVPSGPENEVAMLLFDSRLNIPKEAIHLLTFTLVHHHPDMQELIAGLIPDQEKREEYLSNPCHNNAWIGLTGTDPRDYDDEPITKSLQMEL